MKAKDAKDAKDAKEINDYFRRLNSARSSKEIAQDIGERADRMIASGTVPEPSSDMHPNDYLAASLLRAGREIEDGKRLMEAGPSVIDARHRFRNR